MSEGWFGSGSLGEAGAVARTVQDVALRATPFEATHRMPAGFELAAPHAASMLAKAQGRHKDGDRRTGRSPPDGHCVDAECCASERCRRHHVDVENIEAVNDARSSLSRNQL
jgi:hypothetical protein